MDNTISYDVGAIYYTRCKNMKAFKRGDEWWLIDVSDIISTISDPKEEKLSGKRSIFYFEQFKCFHTGGKNVTFQVVFIYFTCNQEVLQH